MRIRMSAGIWIPLFLLCLGVLVAIQLGRYSIEEAKGVLAGLLPVAGAILLHEAGHALAARLCGVRLRGLRVDLFGARLGLCGMLSYRQELFVAAAGPFVNMISAGAVLVSVWRSDPDGEGTLTAFLTDGRASVVFVVASLGLLTVNLLPVRSLDGGRMLRCALAPLTGEQVADGILTATTALCLGLLWCISVYALLRVGEMLSLFAFSLCLLARMTGE